MFRKKASTATLDQSLIRRKQPTATQKVRKKGTRVSTTASKEIMTEVTSGEERIAVMDSKDKNWTYYVVR